MLEKIKTREDLLSLTAEQDAELCSEIRAFLVEHIAQTGGHLASNLGIVETTLAIHKVFDTSRDRLVFDVGHQSYVHKLLTGRMDGFDTLRTFGGMSGFPKPSESEHDAFIAGHASNAVSVALGMARARTLAKEHHSVIALVGDGALTGGLAYEGLNNAGASREPLIVILNDNGMSITPNVGAISRYLARMRTKPTYLDLKSFYRRMMEKLPGGRKIYTATHKLKERIRGKLIGKTLFEDMGFSYFGPVDGHDLERVCHLLRMAQAMHEPVLLHLITKKGKGFAPAEKTPQNFHGVGKFHPDSGRLVLAKGSTFSSTFGSELTSLAWQDERICAITAAMQYGTGLTQFAKTFPKRYFDVGIAEGHAVSMAAGLAKQGMIPVVAVYSTFLQRAYDMLLHDVAILNLHVVFAVDRAGLVGADGETHHGMFDVGYLRQIPGMQVLCPASQAELCRMLHIAVHELHGPVAIRYPSAHPSGYDECRLHPQYATGDACTIVCYGTMINQVMDAYTMLREFGVSVDVLKLSSIAPLDYKTIDASVKKTGKIVVVEECADHGCVADDIFSHLAQNGIRAVCRKRNLGDSFITHGAVDKLLEQAQLDGASICKLVQEVVADEA